MENFTDLPSEQETSYEIWVCTLVLLGLVSVAGTIGNLLVLGVYVQHYFWPHHHLRQHQIYKLRRPPNNLYFGQESNSDEQLFARSTGTPTFFILVLACVDLMVCCSVVPLTFYLEYIHMRPNADIWCKTHAFLNVCNIMFSSLLVIAIALDRYLAICHPFQRLLTMTRAKYVTVGLAIFCIIYGILGALTNELAVNKNNLAECQDIGDLENISEARHIFYHIVQKGNTASFVLSILVVLILYSLILRVVLKTHRKTRESMSLTFYARESMCSTNANDLNNVKDPNHDSTIGPSSNANPVGKEQPARTFGPSMEKYFNNAMNDNSMSPNGDNAIQNGRNKFRFSIRGITESTLWRELRSASVLFVVAVVYIIVFTPALLTANRLVEFNLLAYNTYYLNNMSNPLIYCFMSQSFRKKLKILLCGICANRFQSNEERLFLPRNHRMRSRQFTQTNAQSETDPASCSRRSKVEILYFEQK